MAKILVVEDSKFQRRAAVLSFGKMGYECIEAATAQEGLEILANHTDISLVVTDMKLEHVSENGSFFAR